MPRGRQISQDIWDSHFDELKDLYLVQEKPLSEIMVHMKENRGIDASKNQYETTFKKWNFRKYCNKSDWEYFRHRSNKRKLAENKESEFYLNDMPIPEKKAKKELGRRFPPRWESGAAPSPETPPGVYIRTPQGHVFVRTPATPRTPSALNPARTPGSGGRFEDHPQYHGLRLDRLPWFQFENMFKYEAQGQVWLSQLFPGRGSPHSPLAGGSPGQALLSSPILGSAVQARARSNSPHISMLSMAVLAELVPESTQQNSAESRPILHSRLRALSLETYPGELEAKVEALLRPSDKDSLVDFLKLMAQLSSNNMLQEEHTNLFLEWVNKTNNRAALGSIFSKRIPTIDAFARRVFESALEAEDVDVVRVLLKAGVDPSAPTTRNGQTPLQIVVAKTRNMELANILLEAGADVNRSANRKTALSVAVRLENIDMVHMLLNANAKVDQGMGICERPVLLEVFETILKSGIDDFIVDLTRLLVEKGANVEIRTQVDSPMTALQAAVWSQNLPLVNLLLNNGAEVNAPAYMKDDEGPEGGTLLQCISRFGSKAVELATVLIAAGANVNAPAAYNKKLEPLDDEAGFLCYTALQAAVANMSSRGNSETIVQTLLQKGADVNAEASEGELTALQLAANQGNVSLIHQFLEAGAQVNAPASKNGMSALEASLKCKNHGYDIVELFLSRGADPNPSGNSLLSFAWDVESAKLLMRAGAKVNPTHGEPPLLNAARIGDIDLVTLLLKSGANVHSTTYNETALSVTMARKHYHIAVLLVEAGAEINASAAFSGQAALTAAATALDLDGVRMLVQAGAQVNEYYPSEVGLKWASNPLPLVVRIWKSRSEMSDEQRNAYHSRIIKAWEITEVLLNAGAEINASAIPDVNDEDPDALGSTALLSAVRSGSIFLADRLIAAGADVNAKPQPFGGCAPIHAAVERGDIDLVQLLIISGANVNSSPDFEQGKSTIQTAIEKGFFEIAYELLRAGADINAPPGLNDRTALQSAVWHNNRELVNTLLQYRAEVDSPGGSQVIGTAFQIAIEKNYIDIANLLLRAGADINAPPSGKRRLTALQSAIKQGHLEFAEDLLSRGANLNASADPECGRTALQSAIEHGYVELAEYLLSKGADIHAPAAEKQGVTALQAAAIKGQLGIAYALLNAGVDVNEAPARIDGRTALEGAAEHGRLDMVQLLLSAGADISSERPRELAEINGHLAVAQLLGPIRI